MMYGQEIYATFRVEAEKSANLAFDSSGIVEKVNVDVGSIVKKGDILANLKNNDLKALYQSSLIALKYAKKDYDRQLRVKNVIDKARFDGVAYKYESAKEKANYQKAMLDKTYLKAPFDGEIFYKAVEVGDVVSGFSPRTIFKIQSLHKRKLIVKFDQKYWKVVKVGDSFEYKVDGTNQKRVGKISKIYPTIDSKDNQITAEVEAKDIKPGLFGTGYIKTRD